MRAKTVLIQELTDKARIERGLPPEPVWEKPWLWDAEGARGG